MRRQALCLLTGLLALLALLAAPCLAPPALAAGHTAVISADLSTIQMDDGKVIIDPGSPVAVQARVKAKDGRTIVRWLGGKKAVQALVAAGWFKPGKTNKGYTVYIAQAPYLERTRQEQELGISSGGGGSPGLPGSPNLPLEPGAMPGDEIMRDRGRSGLSGSYPSDRDPFASNPLLDDDLNSPPPMVTQPGNIMGLPEVLYKKREREREQQLEQAQPGKNGAEGGNP